MGNRINILLNNNSNHSSLDLLTFSNKNLKFNVDLKYLFFIQNFFNNLNIPLHSFFIKRKQGEIYVFVYFFQNSSNKIKNKYLVQFLKTNHLNTLDNKKKKKRFFSKLLTKRKNFADLYFFLLFFSIKFFNTKNVHLSLINLNLLNGFQLSNKKKQSYYTFNLKTIKKNKKNEKIFFHKEQSKNFFSLNYNSLDKHKLFFRKNLFFSSFLQSFNFILINSLIFQSGSLIGSYLRNLIEFNFHNQKGFRQSKIFFFFKRFFFFFVTLNKEKSFFFRNLSSFLLLKGKFKKDGRKKKKIITFNLSNKRQKKDSLVDFYQADILTRFGSLNLIFFLKGQKTFFSISNFNFASSKMKPFLFLFKNKNFLFLFYWLLFIYSSSTHVK